MGIKEAWDTIVLDEYRKRNIGLVEAQYEETTPTSILTTDFL